MNPDAERNVYRLVQVVNTCVYFDFTTSTHVLHSSDTIPFPRFVLLIVLVMLQILSGKQKVRISEDWADG